MQPSTLQRNKPLNVQPFRPQPPRPRFRALRFLARLIGLAALLCALAFGYTVVSNKAFRQTVASVMVGANPKAAFGKNAVTLLVLGKDEDRDHRDRVMQTNARSDTIILAHLDFNARRIDLMSIPRDTRVRVPGYRGYRKINAAHAIGGWEKTAETVHDFLGVSPDSVVVVDYDMLRKVIDNLGGVTVKVDKQLDYDDNWGNLHIHLKPGVQTLNGTQAMGFVRFRHSNEGAGDSDFVRIERQQTLLHAVRARLKDPATWVRVPRVLETVRREMRGNLTYSQLVSLAAFARSVPKENIAMHVLPSRPGRVYVYPDRNAARALAARLFPTSDTPSIGAAPDDESARPRRRIRRARPAAAAAPLITPAPAVEIQPEPDVEIVEETAPYTEEAEPLIDSAPALDSSPVPAEPAEPAETMTSPAPAAPTSPMDATGPVAPAAAGP